jgi:methylaspartate mutase epsilon subunit
MLALPSVMAEKAIIVQEVECIIRKVEELGKGDVAQGTVAAFAAGVLDVPFAPSKYNAGKIMPARDNDGAVRLLDTGNLPFLPSLLEFHKNKMEERGKFENRPVSFQMVIDDVYAIGKGFLVGRPAKNI